MPVAFTVSLLYLSASLSLYVWYMYFTLNVPLYKISLSLRHRIKICLNLSLSVCLSVSLYVCSPSPIYLSISHLFVSGVRIRCTKALQHLRYMSLFSLLLTHGFYNCEQFGRGSLFIPGGCSFHYAHIWSISGILIF